MFGAYQAAAWEVLSTYFRPDIVVGASIGSLNGWAIAGGCVPAEWVEHWRGLERGSRHRWRIPLSPLDGILQPEPFEEWVRDVHASFTPKLDYGLVVTELLRLRPRLVRGPEVTWEHLAASCAILGLLPQRRLNGCLCTDGGLLSSLPVWAAVEMGATRIVAINVLKSMPLTLRTIVSGVRALARTAPANGADLKIYTVSPDHPLGTARDAIYWNREKIERWIDLGRRDAFEKTFSLRDVLSDTKERVS